MVLATTSSDAWKTLLERLLAVGVLFCGRILCVYRPLISCVSFVYSGTYPFPVITTGNNFLPLPPANRTDPITWSQFWDTSAFVAVVQLS
jgi:hypothetical protein